MLVTHRFKDGTLAADTRINTKLVPTFVIVGQKNIAALRTKAGKPQPRDSGAYTMALDIVKAGVGGTFVWPDNGATKEVTQAFLDDATERLNASPNKLSFIADICARRVKKVDLEHGLGDLGPWVVLRWCTYLDEAENHMKITYDRPSPNLNHMINIHIEPVTPWGPTHHRDCPICQAPSDHTEVPSKQCIVTETVLSPVEHKAFECSSCSGVWHLI